MQFFSERNETCIQLLYGDLTETDRQTNGGDKSHTHLQKLARKDKEYQFETGQRCQTHNKIFVQSRNRKNVL